MNRRKYLFPNVIELNLAAGRPLGVNVYLIDGGSEYVLLDVGMEDTLDEVIDLIRAMDFPLSKCKMLIATHADVDHVQALASARERLRTKTAAHPKAAALIETGEPVQTYAVIAAQGVSERMPGCKIDKKLKDGDEVKVGELTLQVLHTPGHTAGQLSFRLGHLIFSGDNIYADGGVGVIDAHHGSNIPEFIASLTRLRDADASFLLPSHGPPFRHDRAMIQATIDRLTAYLRMPDFGTCAIEWPLEQQWKADILAGKMPQFE
ncbi:MAG: MBL fold metallo-hydrolase [Fimbriiglobus sp.]|nr:MBL fold metallo-hydrolase [Fimbriiglobus sp.]